MRQVEKTQKGDTLIEVMLSIAVFAMIAILSINMMNNGLNTAQRTLETQMARNEIDAQAEAIRFIHDNFIAEYGNSNSSNQYQKAWKFITKSASKPEETIDNDENNAHFNINNYSSCSDVYANSSNGHFSTFKSFVVNPRLLIPDYSGSNGKKFTYSGVDYDDLLSHVIITNSSNKMRETYLYPRIVYKTLSGNASNNTDASLDEGNTRYNDIAYAEGIWIDVVGNNNVNVNKSDYYDFYIRACWKSAGSNTQSTLTTVVRLYNPEAMQ